jgi:hypothetical protein
VEAHALGWQHRLGARVKKLAIVVLLVAAGCKRTVVAGSPAASPTASAPGAATPREAVQRFMAAAKAQDLQDLGLIWGTPNGPAIKDGENRDDKDTREKREIIMMCHLKHNSYQMIGDAPAENGERVLAVEVRYKDLTKSTNFWTVRGPSNRWYVRQFGIEALRDICAAR